MRLETVKVSEIDPAPYNPRKDLKPGDPEYESIRKSIESFELVEPLVWNERTGRLVSGHQRLKVLQELGVEEVEVSVVDLSATREAALNLALNKISGEWDRDKLLGVIQEIDDGVFDVTLTGFSRDEIDSLFTYAQPDKPQREPKVATCPECGHEQTV